MLPLAKRYIVYLQHLSSKSTVFIVGKFVISLKTQIIQRDGGMPIILCRSIVSEHDNTPYKEYLLQKCITWADEVRCRVKGALSDLHAVEACYHRDCMSLFFSNRNRKHEQSQSVSAIQLEIDSGLEHLMKVMS